MNPHEYSRQAFQEGHACSQAVLEAFAPRFGLELETAQRLAAGFAGGMRQGGVCGAVSGGFLVLGLVLGGPDCITKSGRDRLAGVTGEFASRFQQRLGALDCPGILGCDVRTAEGREQMKTENLAVTRCAPAVAAAVDILQDLLPAGVQS
jgi:C_GCAxxG_C_C family probable redox protein